MKPQAISDLLVTGVGEEGLPKEGAEDPENFNIDISFNKEKKPVSTFPPDERYVEDTSTPTDCKSVALPIVEDPIISRTLLEVSDIFQFEINEEEFDLPDLTRSGSLTDPMVPESIANPFSTVPKQRIACMPDQEDLYTLIYSCDLGDDNKKDFLASCETIEEIAKKKNAILGITGMLMMYEVPNEPGVFKAIQRLEGSKKVVEKLYNTISKDLRAHNFSILKEKHINERSFGEWHMGCWVAFPDEDELENHKQALFFDRPSGTYI